MLESLSAQLRPLRINCTWLFVFTSMFLFSGYGSELVIEIHQSNISERTLEAADEPELLCALPTPVVILAPIRISNFHLWPEPSTNRIPFRELRAVGLSPPQLA